MTRLRLFWILAAWWLAVSVPLAPAGAVAPSIDTPTHRQVDRIDLKLDDQPASLQTLASDGQGRLIVAVGAQSVAYDAEGSSRAGAIQWLSGDGKVQRQVAMPDSPDAVSAGPGGLVYASAGGRLYVITPETTELIRGDGVDSPHLQDEESMREAVRQQQLEYMQMFGGGGTSMKRIYDTQVNAIEEKIQEIEAVDEAERTPVQTAMLDAFGQQVERLREMADSIEEDEPSEEATVSDAEIDAAMQSARSVTSLAVSESYLFVCASPVGTHGYSTWRLDLQDDGTIDSTEPVELLTAMRGCCGQMDIQCDGDQLIVSENTRFRVAVYDFDGELVSSFGQQDRSSRNGFGSCCNPMNCLPMDDGSVLTAESSIGHIKRFDAEGNLIAYIGKASIGGGCKHCPLAYDASSDRYYMMSQDDNAIAVLASIQDNPMTEAELALADRQAEWLRQVAGTWSVPGAEAGAGAEQAIAAEVVQEAYLVDDAGDHGPDRESDQEAGLLGVFGRAIGAAIAGGDLEVTVQTEEEGLEEEIALYETPMGPPVQSMRIEADGSVQLLSGQYAEYYGGEDYDVSVRLAGSQPDDPKGSVRFALVADQVEMLTGTWLAKGDNEAVVSLQYQEPFTLHRSSEKVTAVTNCENPSCDTAGCDCQESVSETVDVYITEAPEQDVATTTELSERFATYDFSYPRMTYKYKLIDASELVAGGGVDAESQLNELGGQGYEYCDTFDGKMLFKAIDKVTMDEEDAR